MLLWETWLIDSSSPASQRRPCHPSGLASAPGPGCAPREQPLHRLAPLSAASEALALHTLAIAACCSPGALPARWTVTATQLGVCLPCSEVARKGAPGLDSHGLGLGACPLCASQPPGDMRRPGLLGWARGLLWADGSGPRGLLCALWHVQRPHGPPPTDASSAPSSLVCQPKMSPDIASQPFSWGKIAPTKNH